MLIEPGRERALTILAAREGCHGDGRHARRAALLLNSAQMLAEHVTVLVRHSDIRHDHIGTANLEHLPRTRRRAHRLHLCAMLLEQPLARLARHRFIFNQQHIDSAQFTGFTPSDGRLGLIGSGTPALERQVHREGRATPLASTLRRDRVPVQLHQLPGDRQPEAESAKAARSAGFPLTEPLEDMR